MGRASQGRKIGPRPATLDRLKSKRAFRVFHPVVLDNEVVATLEAAQKAYDEAKAAYETARSRHLNYPSNVEAKAEHDDALGVLNETIEVLEDARQDVEDATFTFVFKAVPPADFDVLARAHPPTDEDRAKWAEEEDFPEDKWPKHSPTTFPSALIAACMVEPQMTEEQVRAEIWENTEVWNEQEKMALLSAAYSTNNRATVSLGKAPGRIRPPVLSKPSATDSAFPGASSSDG